VCTAIDPRPVTQHGDAAPIARQQAPHEGIGHAPQLMQQHRVAEILTLPHHGLVGVVNNTGHSVEMASAGRLFSVGTGTFKAMCGPDPCTVELRLWVIPDGGSGQAMRGTLRVLSGLATQSVEKTLTMLGRQTACRSGPIASSLDTRSRRAPASTSAPPRSKRARSRSAPSTSWIAICRPELRLCAPGSTRA
jgi:hypothetical protein